MTANHAPSPHDEQDRRLLILYATETGNAQDVSDRVARAARSLRFRCQIVSVDCYSLENLVTEGLIVFVVSTTGSGVEPRSMTSLWNMLLSAQLPADLFEDLSFAVFGLGDTSYEKFCWPAKLLSRRLQGLGATEICERGEGDEQHPLGIDGALEPWLNTFSDAILALFPLPDAIPPTLTSKISPPRVVLQPAIASDASNPEHLPGSITATLTANQRTTAKDWFQDVRHFEFQLNEDVDYLPGDVAVIHPLASADEVEEFLGIMGWETAADESLLIKEKLEDQTLPPSLPNTFTLRMMFTRYLDFNAVPRRTFFQYLRDFTSDDLEREKLEEFLSKEGADELYDYCYRVRRTIREILAEFRHVSIPKDYIFDVFPFLRPRQFSIASSAKEHPRQVQLCIAIVKYRTKLKIPRKGVCTSYLSTLEPGIKLDIEIQKGFIRLPPSINTPVICVGPGTGVAPMRAVIEERLYLGSQSNTLYFGCRSATKDYHYAEEWRRYAEEHGLAYRVAHSRDGPEGVKRIYVQDLIEEDSHRIWRLIEDEKAWVYISGSSNKMPAAVRAALAKAVEREGGYSGDGATKYIENMIREGRLIEECWS
ncbi:riboflavin synthase domain-like protein [Macrolepiota fuliginosa MF-IS2]|uniref:NADPH-dependent diflavin oxidoreductase 1 n=1 Tax=Macrolepiota fuliginosa MF-IS2 TaxID=1400762 RepID=A0A9P6BYM8_9AGAR|nr:riboflavin synthase domain-like protein [Macrolepiota fuliginosa MF-IS2]